MVDKRSKNTILGFPSAQLCKAELRRVEFRGVDIAFPFSIGTTLSEYFKFLTSAPYGTSARRSEAILSSFLFIYFKSNFCPFGVLYPM
jgi:hypothetical protein